MSLIRKKIGDAGVQIWAEICEQCQYENWMYAADTYHEKSAFGGCCGICHTIVWCDNRENGFFKNYPKPLASSGPSYVVWRDKRLQDFLDFLPKCPVCGGHEYTKTVSNCKAKYDACKKCGAELKHKKFFDVTKDHADVLVYWLEN